MHGRAGRPAALHARVRERRVQHDGGGDQHLRIPARGVLRADRRHRGHQVLPHLRRLGPPEPPQRRVPDRLQQPPGHHLVAEPDHAGGHPVPELHQPHPAPR